MVINIDKPLGWTSSDVVRKLKYTMLHAGYPRKVKIGHAGTLDPLATGVLLICTEKDTKQVEKLQAQSKEYVFTLELGATTVSYDAEHSVSERFEYEHITREMVDRVVENFRGMQQQVPPIYSAKQVDGKRAYLYARDGQQVELRAVDIEIYDIETLRFELPYLTLRVECSKGTYVRSLARDVGVELRSGAYLTELRRTKNGGYSVHDALDLDQAMELLSLYESDDETK
ncbi:MAG: tRNA pseudouridine(55) synthase TruB [Mucinivorans sp.]